MYGLALRAPLTFDSLGAIGIHPLVADATSHCARVAHVLRGIGFASPSAKIVQKPWSESGVFDDFR